MVLGRREFLAGIVATLSIPIEVEAAAAMSLVDLSSLGKALREAADAIGELGDNIAHLASLGRQGWDAVSARATQERLRDISARLTFLSEYKNVRVIASLDEYIHKWESETNSGTAALTESAASTLKNAWSTLIARVKATLMQVQALLGGLERERSDLVTQSVYQDLIKTLGGRSSLLESLSNSSAPTTPAEIDALRVVSVNYKALRDNLLKAIQAINAYIRASGNAN
jgi:hypothetical protein